MKTLSAGHRRKCFLLRGKEGEEEGAGGSMPAMQAVHHSTS